MRALARVVAATAVVALLGAAPGCSAADEPAGAPSGTSTPSQEEGRGPGGTLSAEDRDAIATRLAQVAEVNGVTDPPPIDMVRVVSAVDFARTQVACLHDAGFSAVTLSDDGTGFSVEFPDDSQADAFGLAVYTCEAKFVRDPAQDESRWTREQKLVDYAYLTGTLVDCLTEQGFTIRDIPSEEVFLETWDHDRWNPYEQLAAAGGWGREVDRACPANTPLELIWGQ